MPRPTNLAPLQGLEVMKGEMPLAPFGTAAMQALRGLYKPAQRVVAPLMETLGEQMAEFTPRGGEAMYNLGRKLQQSGPMATIQDEMVKKYLSKMR